MSNAEESGRYWDSQQAGASDDVRYWLAVLEVRRAINRRVTGDPDRLFITDFLARLPGAPVGVGLSVGCGAGELERGVIGDGAASRMVGIDVGEGSIGEARRLAGEHGMDEVIDYEVAEAASWLRREADAGRTFDVVFFHGSLHHIEALESVLADTARLLQGGSPGWLYVDEYVGPSRDEWTEADLLFANALFDLVPDDAKRTPRVWPPIAVEDPTEMIRSSEILALCRDHFAALEERPYWGNVLAPLVSAIKSSCLERPDIAAVLRTAIDIEARLAEGGHLRPHYAAFVGRPLE